MYPRFYIDYFIHLLQADSRHGTHSPFVYRLVDEVIYAKRLHGESRDKVKRLVARLVDWFQPASPLDLVVIDCGALEKPAAYVVEALWPRLHAGSVLVLSGYHRTACAKVLWQSIKAKPDVTVTIDLFRVGLVFFHPGQAKENFKIRY